MDTPAHTHQQCTPTPPADPLLPTGAGGADGMLHDFIASSEARAAQEVASLARRLGALQHAAAARLSQMRAEAVAMHGQGRAEEAAAWEQARRVVHMQV